MIFTAALISAGVAFIAAAVLAIRLKGALPDVHDLVDSPIGIERWPFWVFHFLSQQNFAYYQLASGH